MADVHQYLRTALIEVLLDAFGADKRNGDSRVHLVLRKLWIVLRIGKGRYHVARYQDHETDDTALHQCHHGVHATLLTSWVGIALTSIATLYKTVLRLKRDVFLGHVVYYAAESK
jgi:hypothetical protein